MLGCRRCKTLTDPNHCLQANEGERVMDIGRYQRLVGKLIHLSLIRLDICYVVGVVNCLMHTPTTKHLMVAYHIV